MQIAELNVGSAEPVPRPQLRKQQTDRSLLFLFGMHRVLTQTRAILFDL